MTSQLQLQVFLRAQLRRLLEEHFTREELNTLCHDIGVEYDNWSNFDKRVLCRELVRHAKKHSLLADLVQECRKQQPAVPWPHFPPAPDPDEQPRHVAPPLSSQAIVLLGLILVITLSLLVFGVPRIVTGIAETPADPAPDVAVATFTPEASATPAAPTPTPEATPLPTYNLHATDYYDAPDSVFSMVIPKGWSPYALEPNAGTATIARVTFSPKPYPNFYWRLLVEVSDISRIEGRSIEELAPFVREYIGNAFNALPDVAIETPEVEPSQQAVRVYWSFTFRSPDNAPVPMRAVTDVRVQGQVMTVFTLYVPLDQFDGQEGAIQTLRDSLLVAPELLAP